MNAYVMKWINRITGSPAYQNNAHKIKNGFMDIVMMLARVLILLGISYIIISPLLGMISNAIKDPADIYNPFVFMIPIHFTLDNFKHAFTYMDFGKTVWQTLGVTGSLMLIQIAVCSMAGYGFARFRFPGSNILFAMVIVTIVVPIQVIMVPMYIQFRYVGGSNYSLINTMWPIYVLTIFGMGIRSGLYIYIFRQFFKGLPKEIEEAALIDGAGTFYTYIGIMMPNATSAIITVGLFSFVWQYNDTFFTSLFMNNMNFMQIKLASLPTLFANKENIRDPNITRLVTNAGIILAISPIMAVYLVMQRYFMEGIERSGIVG